MNSFKKGFFNIFRLSDGSFCFFSGVLVSAAINMLTSSMPESPLTLPWNVLVSIILMVIASFLLILIADTVRPCQERYNSKEINVRDWYKEIKHHSCEMKLTILFILTTIHVISSIVLLFL